MATGPVHTTLLLYTPRHRRAVLELDGKLQCEDFCVKTSWTNDWQSGSRHLLNSLAGRGYWTFLPFCGPTCLFRQTQHLADLRLVQDLTRNNLKYLHRRRYAARNQETKQQQSLKGHGLAHSINWTRQALRIAQGLGGLRALEA